LFKLLLKDTFVSGSIYFYKLKRQSQLDLTLISINRILTSSRSTRIHVLAPNQEWMMCSMIPLFWVQQNVDRYGIGKKNFRPLAQNLTMLFTNGRNASLARRTSGRFKSNLEMMKLVWILNFKVGMLYSSALAFILRWQSRFFSIF